MPREKRSLTSIEAEEASPKVIKGLSNCSHFLSPNEYPKETIGLLAFLFRKSLGENFLSDLIDDLEGRSGEVRVHRILELLARKRRSLSNADVSAEKCFIINRLMGHIEENRERFMRILTSIRGEMKNRLTDNSSQGIVQYPEDFRRRENEFKNRREAQELRLLFCFTDKEANYPPSILHLQNRTTEHLSYLLDERLRYDPSFHPTAVEELETLFRHSFMIVAHPHHGVHPTTVYDREGNGRYRMKISVRIISLLHDYMERHRHLITLDNLEVSLLPFSDRYTLSEPRSIPWNTSELRCHPSEPPRRVLHVDLTHLWIRRRSDSNSGVDFAQKLHRLQFSVRLRLYSVDHQIGMTHTQLLLSLPFGIGNHVCQTAELSTRLIIDNIRRFGTRRVIDVEFVKEFIQRYFIHRTGVLPNECVKRNLREELTRASNERRDFHVLEDIYMDFLVPFVQQVEFMAKHPVLAMFHADHLFLGPCSSSQALEAMRRLPHRQYSVIGLRFNTIKIDYPALATTSPLIRTMRNTPCAVRADIFRDGQIHYHTFDTPRLLEQLVTFVSSTSRRNVSRIHILSNWTDPAIGTSKPCVEFSKYYHERLQLISQSNEGCLNIDGIIQSLYNQASGEGENTDPPMISPAWTISSDRSRINSFVLSSTDEHTSPASQTTHSSWDAFEEFTSTV